MNNELDQARENLQNIRVEYERVLNLYKVAKVDVRKAYLSGIRNSVVSAFQNLNEKISESRQNRAARREEEAQIREAELEARRIEEEQLMQERSERKLRIKEARTQKISSIKCKFGTVKNAFLRALSPSNIDAKLRYAASTIGNIGLDAFSKGLSHINSAKERVANYIADQREIREMKAQERASRREEEAQIREAELEARRIEEEQLMQERSERKLRIKEARAQKISSIKCKFGTVKNAFLRALSPSNIDAKLKYAASTIGNIGLGALSKGLSQINNAKERVSDYISEKRTERAIREFERDQAQEEQARANSYIEAENIMEAERERQNLERRKEIKEAFRNDAIEKIKTGRAIREFEKEQAREEQEKANSYIEAENIMEAERERQNLERRKEIKEAFKNAEREELDKKYNESVAERNRLREELRNTKNALLGRYSNQEIDGIQYDEDGFEILADQYDDESSVGGYSM